MAGYILTNNLSSTIDEVITPLNPDMVIVITDPNVKKYTRHLFEDSKIIKDVPQIVIKPGEENKNLQTVTTIWDFLEENKATRKSVIINIGGGVVTDIGGFAASTYKRGIKTVNVPTTLLGAVDAASGGKTGFNYRGLKNEIGSFHMPYKVIISGLTFETQTKEELLSGYAEMVKTAMISDQTFYGDLLNPENVIYDAGKTGHFVARCVDFKEKIVRTDPTETGLRKILNFGHTAGHAFESFRFEKGHPVTHGKAVAHGMLVSLILSHFMFGLSSSLINEYSFFLKNYYGNSLVHCDELEIIIEKINRDKKNPSFGKPAFTLLKRIGKPQINCLPDQKNLNEALELYIDLTE